MTKDQLEILFNSWRHEALPPQKTKSLTETTPPGFSQDAAAKIQNKNKETQNRYSELTHIFQNITYAMQENDVAIAHQIPAHLITSVVWHIPTKHLIEDTYFDAVKDSILYLHHKTQTEARCADWIALDTETPLFHTDPELRKILHCYLRDAWKALGFSESFLR